MTVAVLAALTAFCTLVSAVAAMVLSIRNGRKIEEVHVIVNSRMASVLARVEQLTSALETSDTDVPDDPDA